MSNLQTKLDQKDQKIRSPHPVGSVFKISKSKAISSLASGQARQNSGSNIKPPAEENDGSLMSKLFPKPEVAPQKIFGVERNASQSTNTAITPTVKEEDLRSYPTNQYLTRFTA